MRVSNRILLGLGILLFVLESQAQVTFLLRRPSAPAVPAPTYVVDQSFETVEIPGGWVGSGTTNWNDTSQFVHGLASLSLSAVASYATSTNCGNMANMWLYMRYYMVSNPAGNVTIVLLRDTGTTRCTLTVAANGKLSIKHGTVASSFTTLGMTNSVWNHIWVHYVQGTGADGHACAAWSTDGTRPTTGNYFCSTDAGDATTTVNGFRCYGTFATEKTYYDRILVDDEIIGNSP